MEEMELYWAVSVQVDVTIDKLIKSYILYRFASAFMENKRGAFLAGASYFGCMMIWYIIPFAVPNFVAYGMGILLAFFVMCKTERRNYCQKAYIAVTFFSLRWLSAYMTLVLTKYLHTLVIDTPYMIEHKNLQFVLWVVTLIFQALIGFVLLWFSVKYIIKSYVYKREDMTVKEMCMLLTPSVTGMTGYIIMQFYHTFLEDHVDEAVFGMYGVLAFVHYGISIASIVVITVLFQNVKARQEERVQNELLAIQMENIRQRIGQVETMYEDIRSLRHDMRNHILTLERLHSLEAKEEAGKYIRDLRETFADAERQIQSGNPVTDVILQGWREEAGRKGIRFQSDFHFPAGEQASAFDVSVILNNALQNAIENVESEEQPYISVLSYQKKHAWILEIRNPFNGELCWDAENALPLTSKEKADSHGYGLVNIRRIAGKYFGDLDVVCHDGEFCLSVLLMTE